MNGLPAGKLFNLLPGPEFRTTWIKRSNVAMARFLRCRNRVVEMARVQEPVGVKVVWLHPENTGEKEHVIVGNPNLVGLDSTDFSPALEAGILWKGQRERRPSTEFLPARRRIRGGQGG
jgi:hypothetical protein